MKRYVMAGLGVVFLGVVSVAHAEMEVKVKDNTANSGFSIKEDTTGSTIARFRGDGKVGIGTTNPNSKLEVNGTIHSTSGGVKFPDGTVQTTAAGNGGLSSRAAFQVYRSSNLFVPNNTLTDFAANTIDFDINGYYDTSTHRYTPQIAGYYNFYLYLSWEIDARTDDHSDISAHILKNNLEVADFEIVAYASNLPTWSFTVGGNKVVFMNGTTDYVTFHGYESSWNANGRNIQSNKNVSYAGGFLIAPMP